MTAITGRGACGVFAREASLIRSQISDKKTITFGLLRRKISTIGNKFTLASPVQNNPISSGIQSTTQYFKPFALNRKNIRNLTSEADREKQKDGVAVEKQQTNTNNNPNKIMDYLKTLASIVFVVGASAGVLHMAKDMEYLPRSSQLIINHATLSRIGREELETIGKILDIPIIIFNDGQMVREYEAKCFEAALKACEENRWDIIESNKELFEKLLNEKGESLLLAAISKGKGNAPCVEGFLKRNILVNSRDKTGRNALHLAAIHNRDDLIKLISDCIPYIDTDPNGLTAIQYAVKFKRLEALTVLHSIERSNSTSLNNLCVLSIESDSKECFEFLFSKFSLTQIEHFFSTKLDNGNNLLHHALIKKSDSIFSGLVLDHYQNVKSLINQPNQEGQTPLHFACIRENEPMIRLLFGVGGDINAKDHEGKTCMHLAAITASTSTIRLLYDMGCDLLIHDKNGKTPEFYVTEKRKDATGPMIDKTRNCLATILKLQGMQEKKLSAPPNFVEDPPENLVFEGGGPKGIVYLGALKELESRNLLRELKRVAGTSAGAITAGLLATGHTLEEITELLKEKDLSSFLDVIDPKDKPLLEGASKGMFELAKVSWIRFWGKGKAIIAPIKQGKILVDRFVNLEGLCRGEEFRKWIESRIKEKTGKDFCTFGELEELIRKDKKFKEICVFAVQLKGSSPAEIIRLGTGDPKCKDVIISDAIRASMSIPGVFEAQMMHYKTNGHRTISPEEGYFIDAGLVNNFPINAYDQPKGKDSWAVVTNRKTLGLSIAPPGKQPSDSDFAELTKPDIHRLIAAYHYLEKSLIWNQSYNKDRVIEIPAEGIGLLDFQLTKDQKAKLIASGKNTVGKAIPEDPKV
ncbi:MAG: ankyrin repeat domain-containing protein [Parachlamydiaceae bacterium]|nr:ankyrin repeat domain-containing protein [Parachlamydiaceae bacterium]